MKTIFFSPKMFLSLEPNNEKIAVSSDSCNFIRIIIWPQKNDSALEGEKNLATISSSMDLSMSLNYEDMKQEFNKNDVAYLKEVRLSCDRSEEEWSQVKWSETDWKFEF